MRGVWLCLRLGGNRFQEQTYYIKTIGVSEETLQGYIGIMEELRKSGFYEVAGIYGYSVRDIDA